MPFTFAHPAAVLPLTYLPRRWYSLTGLVVGSVTPDFEYFMRMTVKSEYSHTPAGLFYFDLPVGLALAFLFHLTARDALIDNLPLFLKKYLTGYKKINWLQTFRKQWFIIIISILVGAFSHLLWDGCTHYYKPFDDAMPFLLKPVNLFGETVPVYNILQHSSTVIGLLFIFYAIRKLPVDKKMKKANISFRYWVVVTLITLTVAAAKLAFSIDKSAYQNYIIPPISGGMIAMVLAPFIVRDKKRAKQTQTSNTGK